MTNFKILDLRTGEFFIDTTDFPKQKSVLEMPSACPQEPYAYHFEHAVFYTESGARDYIQKEINRATKVSQLLYGLKKARLIDENARTEGRALPEFFEIVPV